MKTYDIGAFIIIMGLVAAAIGFGSAKMIGKDDQVIEEKSEEVLENIIEDVMGLDDDALEGVIDLTPGSNEA